MASDLVQQGIELFRSGDREGAYRVLRDAAEQNPQDARAWYYLAGATDEVEERRRYLERVLEIMPENDKAREQLAKLPPKPAANDFDDLDFGDSSAGQSAPQAQSAASQQATGEPIQTIQPPSAGFSLPVTIPGAPQKVSPTYLWNLFMQQFQNGIAILRKQPGVYPKEAQRASWWLFWAYIGVCFVIIALATTITSAIANAQLAATFRELENTFGFSASYTPPNVFNILLTFLLTIPISIGALYGAIRVSHGWVKNQGGQASLVTHAYTIALPVVTASIISNLLSLVLTIIPLLGALGGLISLALWVYSLFVAVDGIEMIHKVDRRTGWWTMGVMLVVQLVIGVILGLILSPFILASGFGSFL
jgi:hypothetical protein